MRTAMFVKSAASGLPAVRNAKSEKPKMRIPEVRYTSTASTMAARTRWPYWAYSICSMAAMLANRQVERDGNGSRAERAALADVDARGAPRGGIHVGDRLRERPHVAAGVLAGVLTLAEGMIFGLSQYPRARCLGTFEVAFRILDAHEHAV